MEISDMVVKLLSAAAIAAAATTAQGAFSIGTVDFGGFPSTSGNPLNVAGGTFAIQTTTDPGTHGLFVGAGLGVVGWGTTVHAIEDDGSFLNTPFTNVGWNAAGGTIVPAAPTNAATTTSFGGFFARSSVLLTSDDDALVARVRVSSGAAISLSGGVVVAVQGLGDATESNLVLDESGVIGSVAIGDNRTDGANYQIDIRFLGNFGTNGDVYDIYVQVPTPGTAALFGVAGLATIRRRRA